MGGVAKIFYNFLTCQKYGQIYFRIFCIFGKIIFMYNNMMDSMKKPVKMETKMAKKSTPKAGLTGNQSKLDANKNGKIDAQDFKMLKNK